MYSAYATYLGLPLISHREIAIFVWQIDIFSRTSNELSSFPVDQNYRTVHRLAKLSEKKMKSISTINMINKNALFKLLTSFPLLTIAFIKPFLSSGSFFETELQHKIYFCISSMKVSPS